MTAKEWIERDLPEPYKGKAMNAISFHGYMPDEDEDCLSDALLRAFYWHDTLDGFGFWEKVKDMADTGTMPPADQSEDPKPTPADFSTQYMLGGEPYHPEDDETELQRLIDGRDEMNDGIKVIQTRQNRFKLFVAKQEGVKG